MTNSTVFFLLSVLLFWMIPEDAHAKKTMSKFLSRKYIRKVKVSYPPTLNFSIRKKISRLSNEKVFEPMFNLEAIIINKRHVSRNYLNVFVVQLTSAPPFNKESVIQQARDGQSGKEVILSEGEKRQGTPGYWWKIRQRFAGITYVKYVVIFGDDRQTVYMAGVYPAKLENSFIPSAIKTSLMSAIVTKAPI